MYRTLNASPISDKVQCECESELQGGIKLEEHLPPTSRDAMYGRRTDVMCLHYRVKEGEGTIEYVDVMNL